MYRANSLAILRVLKLWILSPVLIMYFVVMVMPFKVFKQGGGLPRLWLLFLALILIINGEIVCHLAMT